MLEIATFRDSPEAIFADLERRGLGRETVEQVIATDEKWRALIDEGNKLRSDRNRISRGIAAAKKAGDDTIQKPEDIAGKLAGAGKATAQLAQLQAYGETE